MRRGGGCYYDGDTVEIFLIKNFKNVWMNFACPMVFDSMKRFYENYNEKKRKKNLKLEIHCYQKTENFGHTGHQILFAVKNFQQKCLHYFYLKPDQANCHCTKSPAKLFDSS